MNIKIRLSVTGTSEPNRTRTLIEPRAIEFEVPEDKVDAVVVKIDKAIRKLEDFKNWLKF